LTKGYTSYYDEIQQGYEEGVRERYWRLVLPAAAAVLAKSYDKAWLAECGQRKRALNFEQREEIQDALESDFGFKE